MTHSEPTLYDVAREAGVSLATASRTLNGSARVVKEPYRERVLAAAAKLGYTTNLSAQAVARGASATVALLVSDIADPYFAAIAAGVIRAAAEHGLGVTMAVTERDTEREVELVRVLRGQRPRAVILAGSRFDDEPAGTQLESELTAFQSGGGRVALISNQSLPFQTVAIDNTGGARALAQTLVGLGYRGFALLAGPRDLVTAIDRAKAFAAALPSPPATIIHGAFSRDAGYQAAVQLIEQGLDGVDAIFAVNDVMAIGALSALRDHGIDVPGRIAVAGFDDISTARDVTPALTTVHVDLEAAGAAAVALALADDASAAGSSIGADVVVRASTPGR